MFGMGEEGQLGSGHEANSYAPQITDVDPNNYGLRALSVACGHTHTVVVVGNESLLQNEERRRRGEERKNMGRRITRFGRRILFRRMLKKLYKPRPKPVIVQAKPKAGEMRFFLGKLVIRRFFCVFFRFHLACTWGVLDVFEQ
tara:strand:+ start:254 stop:682 length:429 start_codon:yes stop_codon:yes gene_type:complete